MDNKNKIAMSAYGIGIAAILVGSFFAVSIGQQAAQGNATSHNATSSAAAGNATTAGNKSNGGGIQGTK